MANYVELQCCSNYSFLRGASRVEELLLQAKLLGMEALAITDHNTLAGVARAHARAKEVEIRLIIGCRLDLADGPPLLAYPTDRAAYGRLCRMLTIAKGRGEKGTFDLRWSDIEAASEGLLVIVVPDRADENLDWALRRTRKAFVGRCYLALTPRRLPGEALRLHELSNLAHRVGVPPVATGDVLYHAPERRILQDVIACIREGCTIDDAGYRRERHADRHLKPPEEVARRLADYPVAIARSVEIAARCTFSLDELTNQYPDELQHDDEMPHQGLERLVRESLPLRYPEGPPPAVEKQLAHELRLIANLEYAPYFLTVNSIVRFARSKGILCQGRGSAANSAVCYVLGVTAIDPVRSGLLFERFVSEARKEPPDIDVDFESDRREEVIQWVYERYGRDRAALCATVMCFGPRGAIRDVGKVLGLTEDVTGMLASQVWGWSKDGVEDEHAESLNLNLSDPRLRLTIDLARDLIGFPRQLGTHPGGFVLTRDRLDELVPVEPAAMAGRQIIEWDKDDIDALKFMKVDVLGLGMLGCMRRAFDLLEEHRGIAMDIATIPPEDPKTYAMIRKADTLGTFQIESRAQMSMLPRLKPTTFYDLVVQVAIVRPGPIQGDMVHPYLRRREGLEPVHYPKPELKNVLGKTLGVPLFQEQAMQVAIQCAGFTPSEADQLRRSMATFKFTGGVSHFKDKLIEGMVDKGYEREFAERTFSQLEGFGSYGFPESHAASFALVAYASAWMKCHHPDIFCAALLNAQPMGFYAPAQIVRDATEHRVLVRPVCVSASRWDCTLERRGDGGPGRAVRLGLRMVKGLQNEYGAQLVARRGNILYASVEEIWRRAGIPPAQLERLAEADAFQGMALDRRQALWSVRGLADTVMPLFAAADGAGSPQPELVEPVVPLMPLRDGREVVEDYASVGLSLRRHPVSFLREELQSRGMIACRELLHARDGRKVVVPGIILVRQKPGSAKGVMFITIEDETGIANLVLWADRFEKQRRLVLSAGMVACHGRVQREGEVIHVVTDRLEDLSDLLRSVGGRDLPIEHGRGDGATHPAGRDPREGPGAGPGGRPVRDIYIPDLRLGSGIKVPTRDFR